MTQGAASGGGKLGYVELLRRYPNYRRLWLGGVISFLGDWFNTIALYTAVKGLSGDARAIAAVMVAKMLPPFLVSPIAGPLVDRFDRRKLLIVLDVVPAGVTVALVFFQQVGSLVGLYVCTVVLMACSGIALPAKNAVLPMLVPHGHIPTANALGGGTWSVMLTLGASLGGIAVQLVGVPASFLIDGATFLISALFFWHLPALRPPARTAAEARFIDGLRYLWRQPYILVLTCLKPAQGLWGGVLVLIPIYGTDIFPATSGPLWVGFLYAARGLGALIGSMGLRLLIGDTPRTLRRAILASFAMVGAAYLALSQVESLWQAALCYLGAAIGAGGIWVFSGTLLQMDADRAFHGRVFSLEFGVMTLAMAGSSWLTGESLDRGRVVADIATAAGWLALLAGAAWAIVLSVHRQSIRSRVRARLSAGYAAGANEAHELAMSRLYLARKRSDEEVESEPKAGGDDGPAGDETGQRVAALATRDR